MNRQFLHEHRRFVDLKYFLPPPFPVSLFISLSSGNAIIDVVPKGHDEVAQLVPLANNSIPPFLCLTLFLSLSLLIVCVSCITVSLYLSTRIIITMVGTAWQTMLCEILGILDCYGNKLRPLTNEKSYCFKNKIYGMRKYLFNLTVERRILYMYRTFFDGKCFVHIMHIIKL